MDIMGRIKERLENKKCLILVISLLVMVITCFLPVYKVTIWGISATQNYIYNDGELADGIFVILGAIATLVLLFFKKDKFTLIPLGIVAIVLINFLVKTADKDLMQYTTFWYWLLYIGFVGSAVTAIMLFLDKNNDESTNKPKVVNAQYEEVKSELGFCPNCGTPKKSKDAAFCPNCGGKY